MKFAQATILVIQVLFISLVFLIVFYNPHKQEKAEVLGSSIDVADTLNICLADINKDSIVNELDLEEMKISFLKTSIVNKNADINKDNLVDLADFYLLQKYYYKNCK